MSLPARTYEMYTNTKRNKSNVLKCYGLENLCLKCSMEYSSSQIFSKSVIEN